ncbi:MAG: FliM/FliN family flagellar motor switch protein [Campylobacterota bacterium]|nr:FliM/FliN family flagellar motor switch protein [Campylobacterota bacterium]
MASDLSNIIRNEIANTLESLLSVSASVTDVSAVNIEEISDEQCIKVEGSFSFSSINTSWSFYIPTLAGTKFEYLMLGGIADLKTVIDDEITDAVKEIISTMCGSMTTSINAQGFEDISDVKFTLGESSVIKCSEDSSSNIYNFTLDLNGEELILYISFDDVILPFIEGLTGEVVETKEPPAEAAAVVEASGGSNSLIASMLGEDSVENLRLLFDIKMRLSVRLGTKVALLRDVISWDIGEIIELTQMTNEPLDILVNGVVIGQGEAVIVDGKFGVKIKHIGETKIS